MGDRGEFFPCKSRRLYGFLHEPRATEAPLAVAPAAVVFVHPFMEERQDAHPFLRSIAGQVSARGLWAMRFDLHGCGASDAWSGHRRLTLKHFSGVWDDHRKRSAESHLRHLARNEKGLRNLFQESLESATEVFGEVAQVQGAYG